MVGIRYPRPLVPGDLVGVATPSSGVPASLHDRLDAALEAVAAHGFRTRVGELARVDGVTSGPPEDRAAELTEMMTDPSVRAVIPPWGGDLAVDLLDRLDFETLAVDPTWLIGYSDLSTLMTPLTLATGVATLHGANLMDTPYELPVEFSSWVDVVTALAGATLVQSAAPRRRIRPWGPWATEPRTRDDAYEAGADSTATTRSRSRADSSADAWKPSRSCPEPPPATSTDSPAATPPRACSSTSRRPKPTASKPRACYTACASPAGSTTPMPCSSAAPRRPKARAIRGCRRSPTRSAASASRSCTTPTSATNRRSCRSSTARSPRSSGMPHPPASRNASSPERASSLREPRGQPGARTSRQPAADFRLDA